MKKVIQLSGNHLFAAVLLSFFGGAGLYAQSFPTPTGFTLPAGKTIVITYDVDVNANACPNGGIPAANISNQSNVSGSNFATVQTDDPDIAGASNPTLTPFSGLSIGNLVYKDINRNGTYESGTDQGLNGVLVRLYLDNGDGVLTVADGAAIATTTTTTVSGQAGVYSFAVCPGNYIVEIAASNFSSGGALYDNTLMTGLVSSPVGGAPDPDNDVNNDDNGDPVAGFGVASQAITVAYGTEPVNDGDTDPNTNLTLDFGFKTPTTVTINDVTQNEGTGGSTTAFNFTVTRNDNGEAFNLTVNTVDISATSPSDFTAISGGTVSFTAGGALTATVTVLVNQDNIVEPVETFNVLLSGAPGGVILSDPSGLGTITNDDAAVVTLSGGTTQNEGNSGTTSFTFTATLDNPVQGGFTVAYNTNDGTATAPSDYIDNDGTLSFTGTAGETKTITVLVNGDNLVELNENFTETLGVIVGPPAGVTTAGTPQTGTITNDDAATVSIAGNVSQAENISPQAFSVTLSNPVDAAVTVLFNTSNGTATTADNDYIAIVNQTVTFTAGSTAAQTVNVTINNDTKVEADELYNVAIGTLNASGRNVSLGTGAGTGTIVNDDNATVTLSGGTAQNEGNSGTTAYIFTATLNNAVQGGFTANYTTNDGTATTADNDYTDNDGALIFTGTAGETKTFTVQVNGDLNIEANETFQTAINSISGASNPAAVTIAGSPQTATITNDEQDWGDAPTAAQSGFAGTYPTLSANNGVRHAAALGGLHLGATIDGDLDGQPNATATGDGADEDGVTIPALLVTGTTANITVNASGTGKLDAWMDFNRDGDWADAGEQIFSSTSVVAGNNTLSFSVPAGASVGTSFARFRLSSAGALVPTGLAADGEVEDYQVNISSVSLSINDVTLAEGNAGTTTFSFTVSLSSPAGPGGVTFDIATQNNTATTANNDYVAKSLTAVTIPSGSSTYSFDVTVNGDLVVEDNESFFVNVSNVTGAGVTDSQGLGTINNDDAASLTLSGGIAQNETNAGTVSYTFTATLSAAVQGGFQVPYSTNDGTATTADNDYVDNDGTLTFTGATGETKTFTVLVNGDSKVELDETFTTALGTLTATSATQIAAITKLGSPQTGTVTNDDAAVVAIAANVSQLEATTPQTFSVTLSNPVDVPVTVQFNTANGTATTADNDYNGIVNQTVTFAAGSTTAQTVNVTINNDTKVEADETFNVSIGTLSAVGRNVSLGTSTRTGTILNDDNATVTLSGGIAQNEGNAGTTAYTFNATLNNAVQGGFTANYTTNDGTATTADNDYADNDGALTFTGTAGETKTITVLVNGDTKVELNETFTVGLGTITGAPPGVTTAGSPQTGTITNDDAATVSFAGNVAQSEALTPQAFTVTLSNPVDVPVTMVCNSADGTATIADNDYAAVSGQTVTFAAGSTTGQIVNVTIINDNKVEANETYTLNLSSLNASGRNVNFGTSSATGTINNDDAATLTLSGGVAQNEGNSGTTAYTFTATLSAAVQGGFTVPFTTNDGTATTADNDYIDNDGTLTFAGNAGETKTITVLVNGDNKVELNETLTEALGAITGAPAGVTVAGSPQTATINNDDAATVSLAANISQAEALTPQVFSVTLSNPVDAPVTVQFSTSDGTATTADNDYTGIASQTVTFAAGTTAAQTVNVTINNDSKVETDELYNVSIGTLAASGRNVSLGTTARTGTIVNDDNAVVTLSGGIAQNEGNSGNTPYVFTATLSAAVQGGLTAAYLTNDGTATTADLDYTDNDGSLVFSGTTGETKTFTVNVIGDHKVEANETFQTVITGLTLPPGITSVSIAGSPQTATVNNDEIDFGDAPDSYSTLLASNGARHNTVLGFRLGAGIDGEDDGLPTANASGDGADDDGVTLPNPLITNTNANITVNASLAGKLDAWVDFNNNGSFADAGEKVFNNVALVAGNNALSFAVPNGATPALTFARFRLSSAGGLSFNGLASDGEVEDYQVQIVNTQFSINDPTVNEGNSGTSNLTFTVTRSNNASACSVNYAVTGGSATTADNDYQALAAGTLNFTAGGSLTAPITVVVNGDTKVELNETVDITLSTPVNGTILDGSGTGTIVNDDAAVITVSNITVTEGDAGVVNATFNITMSNPSDANVVLNYTTVDGSATVANSDYQAASGSHTFTPGQTTKQVTVAVNGDCSIEPDENYILRLSSLVNNGRNVSFSGGGATLDGTGGILNDDALPIITCPANLSRNVDLGVCTTSVTLPLPTTSSICGSSVLEFHYRTVDAANNPTGPYTAFALSGSNTVVFSRGRYEIEWRVTDGSGSSLCSYFLTVIDNQAPSIICPANQIISADGSCSGTVGSWSPVSLSDNCTATGSIVVTQTPPAGTVLTGHNASVLVTLTANDGNGNTSSCSFTVTLKDLTPPVAKCKNLVANLGSNGSVTVAPSAIDNGSSDNCTFSLSLTPNTFTCSNIGLNTVTLKVTDAGGNTAICSAVVTVKDVSPPNALCKNPTIFLDNTGHATLSVAQVNNGSSDACGISTMSISKSAFNCSEITATQVVTLSMTDNNGNSASCLSYVTVKDAIAPTAVCEDVTVQLAFNGKVTVYGANLAVNSTDNCSVWSYSPVAKIYTTANIGMNNLTVTVKDWSGNAATCVSVVTVLSYNNSLKSPPANRSEEESVTKAFDLPFNVFPNPSSGETTVAFELPAEQTYILRMFDLSGRLLFNREDTGMEGENMIPLSLGNIPNGIYILDFLSENHRGQFRLIVRHD